MGGRGTAVLVVLIVLAGALVYFDNAPHEAAPDAGAFSDQIPTPPPTVRPLLNFRPADVVALRLEHDGVVRAARRTDAERWQPPALGDFIDTLAGLGALAQIPAEPADLHDYGLQPPQSVLQIQLRGGASPLVIQIGEHNPATTGVYARVGTDGPVVLAGALLAWEFEKAFKALGQPNAD